MTNHPFTEDQLFRFVDKAGKSTYPTLGVETVSPGKSGFKELTFSEGDFSYTDSYSGYYRSRGTELVRFKNQPVWMQLYGGGMVEGKESIAEMTFTFLKKAFLADEDNFKSFRGPHRLRDGDWLYTYQQDGNIFEFWGYEEISYKSELVFFHRTIGGIILPKNKTS